MYLDTITVKFYGFSEHFSLARGEKLLWRARKRKVLGMVWAMTVVSYEVLFGDTRAITELKAREKCSRFQFNSILVIATQVFASFFTRHAAESWKTSQLGRFLNR